MTAPVTVYFTQTCPWCDRVKDYLHKNGVPFEEKDVARDYDAAMEMIKRSGQQGVPVIATENEVIVGFDQARLAKIVDAFGRAKRPPLGLLAADAQQYFERHPDIAANYPEGTKGIFVGDVRANSVAERAGVKNGDVITSVAGKRVRNIGQLDQMIDTLDAGDKVSFRYIRDGEDATSVFQF
ncbi:MAG: PDZ domain-containing protein [Thermomicrobiales bacterium]|jgi:glutaredoxin-like YruB-family protein|nr:PDZ domain-containing protein [Thermomicrobiales bacterium]